ncbi:MAG TPA: adenosylcobinamide-GDP ribazoletransferase [Candidatus Acidoferrales bacterium]|nr:adenosylcobinamide-GDP ribazoletransferase [Candidatus Acidoferrales bacterium]
MNDHNEMPEAENAESDRREDIRSLAITTARDLRTALAALTVLPFERSEPRGSGLARSSLYFPLVGLLIGAALLATNHIGSRSTPAVSAVLLVATWAVLARDFDGWPICLIVWPLKWWFLARHPAVQSATFLFAPLLGRWSMVVLATGARDAENPGRKFNPGIQFREFALTSVTAGGVLLTLAQFLGIVVFVCIAAVVLAARLALHRWIGGIRWSLLVCASMVVELLVLALLTMLAGAS